MRVLMLLSKLDVGGAEKMALHLAGALPDRGVDVVVGAVYGGGALRGEFASHALAVHDGLAGGRFDPRAAWRVGRLIRRHAVDAVLVVDAVRNALLCGTWGARLSLRRVAKVLWCHACAGHGRPGGRMPGLLRDLRRFAPGMDTIVTVARWQRREFARLGLPPRKMCVIENGIALPASPAPGPGDRARIREELHLPPAAFLLVQVANYWPEKDPAWLLEGVHLARSRRPDLHLALVGRGMDSDRVRDRIRRWGLEDAVTTPGEAGDVNRALSAADAFVLASRHETLPMAVLEAMSHGLPVLVSDLPAFEDMLTSGVDALTCPPGDAAALARTIVRLAGDRELRTRLGLAARRRAEHYSLDRMADRFARMLHAATR